MINIETKIKNIREEKGYTQELIAEKVGIAKTPSSSTENNR